MKKNFSLNSPGKNLKSETFLKRLWRWLIAPSSQVEGREQIRQATLLTTLMLGLIFVALMAVGITAAVTGNTNYIGYRDTLISIFVFTIVYALSRTRHVQMAAGLAVAAASIAVYASGMNDPVWAQAGLLDYLIIPIWLSSLYLGLGQLALLILAELAGLVVFTFLSPEVTLNDILIGPSNFIIITSVFVILLTRHRNLLEKDRRAELAEKEQRSRHEAARAGVLLRVAERLNTQLDLDTLLKAISEEIARALNTPVSLVTLYDIKQNSFYPTKAMGISPDLISGMSPYPRTLYDQTIKEFGKTFGLPDLHVFSRLPNLDQFKKLNLRSLAFATMEYGQELIGSLNAITVNERRDFTEDELLLLQGLADQAALAIINTRLYKDAHRRLEHLQALRAIDIAISTNHDLEQTLSVLLEQIMKQLQVDAAVILLLDEAKGQLEFGSSRGFQTLTLRFTSLRIGEGMAGRAAQERQIVHIHDLGSNPQSLVNATSLAKEGFISYYAAPLIAQEQVKGVLEVFHRSPLDPDHEWLSFLETLAGQAAIAIESTSLFEDLQRTNQELSKAYDSTIEGWSHALDLRDKETEGHTLRVTELTMELAKAFGLKESELVHVRRGALLHDIGKMGVPDRILLKEGPLTIDEWDIMHQHPIYAHEMLRTIQYLRPALDIPYCHHEKWDGTGYPRGLKGEEIPTTARIFAIADVWDALTSDRPYRSAWSREKALEHIRDHSGRHFDPKVVDIFIHFIEGGRESHG